MDHAPPRQRPACARAVARPSGGPASAGAKSVCLRISATGEPGCGRRRSPRGNLFSPHQRVSSRPCTAPRARRERSGMVRVMQASSARARSGRPPPLSFGMRVPCPRARVAGACVNPGAFRRTSRPARAGRVGKRGIKAQGRQWRPARYALFYNATIATIAFLCAANNATLRGPRASRQETPVLRVPAAQEPRAVSGAGLEPWLVPAGSWGHHSAFF